MFQPPINVDFKFLPSYVAPEPEYVDFRIGETDYSGSGVLSGSVRIRGEIGAGFAVDLHAEDTGERIGTTTTDAVGTFEFTHIEKTQKYFMAFKDPTGEWEYRVSSRRNPT